MTIEHFIEETRDFLETDTGYTTPCWMWQGIISGGRRGGYGHIWAGRKFLGLAHRVYYEREYGPIPKGLVLHHLCDTRACVRPIHLLPVTQKQNLAFKTARLESDRCPACNGRGWVRDAWSC